MAYSTPPGKFRWYVVASVSLFLIPLVLIGNPATFLVLLLVYTLPSVAWFLLGKKVIGPKYLFYVLPHTSRRLLGFITPWRNRSPGEVQYFLGRPARIRILYRIATVYLAALGLSAFLLPFFVPAYTESGIANYLFAQNIYVDLTFLMIGVLLALPFLLFPAWIFEDVGLRHYTPGQDTIGVPGAELKEIVAGFGILLSVIGMLPLFQNDPTLASDFTLSLMVSGIMVLPLALTTTVVFVYNVEPSIIGKLHRSTTFDSLSVGVASVVQGAPKSDLALAPPMHGTEAPKHDSAPSSYCSYCGAPLSLGATFCPSCGSKL